MLIHYWVEQFTGYFVLWRWRTSLYINSHLSSRHKTRSLPICKLRFADYSSCKLNWNFFPSEKFAAKHFRFLILREQFDMEKHVSNCLVWFDCAFLLLVAHLQKLRAICSHLWINKHGGSHQPRIALKAFSELWRLRLSPKVKLQLPS